MPQQPQQPPLDPVVARALQLLKGQNVTEPIQVVTPDDYANIHLPPALRPTTATAEGFRVWRGPQPDAPIYVNRNSKLYEDASAALSANNPDSTPYVLLAAMLEHEHTHSTHKDEPPAWAAEGQFLQSQLGSIPADKQEAVRRFLQTVQERAKVKQ